MRTKALAWWNSLPPFVKGAIVVSVGSATGVIRHVLQNPNACMTEVCWKGYLVSAMHAGGVTLVAYIMQSPFANTPPPPAPPTTTQV